MLKQSLIVYKRVLRKHISRIHRFCKAKPPSTNASSCSRFHKHSEVSSDHSDVLEGSRDVKAFRLVRRTPKALRRIRFINSKGVGTRQLLRAGPNDQTLSRITLSFTFRILIDFPCVPHFLPVTSITVHDPLRLPYVPVLGSSPVHLPFALHFNPKNVLYRKVSSFRLFKILFLEDQILRGGKLFKELSRFMSLELKHLTSSTARLIRDPSSSARHEETTAGEQDHLRLKSQ